MNALMKAGYVTASLALALGGGMAFGEARAKADTPHCVSKHEYHALRQGWTKAHVRRLFDIPGHYSGHHGYYTRRDYIACWGHHTKKVVVWYFVPLGELSDHWAVRDR